MWVTRVGLVELPPPGVHGRPESPLTAVVRVHQEGSLLPHVVRPVRLLPKGACDGRGLGRSMGEQNTTKTLLSGGLFKEMMTTTQEMVKTARAKRIEG